MKVQLAQSSDELRNRYIENVPYPIAKQNPNVESTDEFHSPTIIV